MKKLFCIISLVFSGIIVSSAQNVVVQQNVNGGSSGQPDNQYYINGISTREDIGGVEVGKGEYVYGGNNHIRFTNYNDFAVSVIYEVNGKETGTIILKAGETKESGNTYYHANSFKLIARRMGGSAAAASPQDNVVIINGYLAVYPEDLGHYRVCDFPYSIIRNINFKGVYGRHNWRLPTREELSMMATKTKELKLSLPLKYMCIDADGNPIKFDAGDYYSPDSHQFIRLVSSN